MWPEAVFPKSDYQRKPKNFSAFSLLYFKRGHNYSVVSPKRDSFISLRKHILVNLVLWQR